MTFKTGAGLSGEGGAAVFEDRVDDLVEGVLGGEVDGALDAVEVGDAAGHVVEGLAVGLLIGEVFDLARRAGGGDDAFGEVVDGDFLVAAEVVDPPYRDRGGHELDEG